MDESGPVSSIVLLSCLGVGGATVGLVCLALELHHRVDRSRLLAREMREVGEEEKRRLAGQVEVLYRRARIIKLSIITAATS